MDTFIDGVGLQLWLARWGVISLIVAAAVATAGSFLVSRVRKQGAMRRVAKASESACIVCGSEDVVRDAETARCRACGYVGRADGGGALSASDALGLYASTNHLAEMREGLRIDLNERRSRSD